ncbi:MAG: hypothetical protein JO266_06845 [Acidobacteria bacterium]|nr:hypothetical protein [Acidobacteriota bacterium]
MPLFSEKYLSRRSAQALGGIAALTSILLIAVWEQDPQLSVVRLCFHVPRNEHVLLFNFPVFRFHPAHIIGFSCVQTFEYLPFQLDTCIKFFHDKMNSLESNLQITADNHQNMA